MIIISCEHAGSVVPADYAELFKDREDILNSHRGYDIGALEVAQFLESSLKAPLFHTNITRLLVEANRSIGNKELFSEFTENLDRSQKDKIIADHYNPYREAVTKAVLDAIEADKRVIHLSIHSFTPVFEGEERNADVGLLFDSGRGFEKKFCLLLKNDLIKNNKGLKVKLNYPYKGTDDGFTTELRKKTGTASYAGIEIEVNQKLFTDPSSEKEKLKETLASSIKQAVIKFKENYL